MPRRLDRITTLALIVNIFLFLIKAVAGIVSNSIAVISEAINSLTDIITSVAIKYSVRLSRQAPDKKHQFGHAAAQPLAAFIVAAFALVAGIKVIEESIKRIINPQDLNITAAIYGVLILNIFVKIILNRYQVKVGKLFNSAAIKAAAVDSINDVLASAIALLGIICASLGLQFIDGIAGILVAFFILRSGYEVARENIDFLMGKSADDTLLLEIVNRAMQVDGVNGFNDIRSYYVGDKFHVEFHIEVKRDISTKESHDIGKEVQKVIEEMEHVQRAFIHIDPV
ncbi:cation diffusion facilitator family transporter [Bacteroidota bacterium]